MNLFLKDFVKEYATYLKWGLVIVNIATMMRAVQALIGYTTILEQTALVQQQTQRVNNEISYFNNFQLKYLNSHRAAKILAHENGVLAYNETPIVFKQADVISAAELTPPPSGVLTPREEWKLFFAEKLSATGE